MSKNPILLLIRFLMELAAIVIFALWGWRYPTEHDWLKYGLAIGLPLFAATIWGVFRIPNDPKPAPVTVPGIVRLAYELVFFGFATWALYDMGFITFSYVFGGVTIFSYLASYDRTYRMLMNRT